MNMKSKTKKIIIVRIIVGLLIYSFIMANIIFFQGTFTYSRDLLIIPFRFLFNLDAFAWIVFLISEIIGWVFFEVKYDEKTNTYNPKDKNV